MCCCTWSQRRSPGRPTDEEEEAALSKEHLMNDPSLTLRAAGVTDGCWLLARFASLSVRSAPVLSDLLGRDVPQNIMRRILARFPVRLTHVLESGNRQYALDLYLAAEQLPSHATAENFRADGYTLDGPLFEGSSLTVCFKGLKVFVAKCLGSDEYARATALQTGAASSAAPWSAHVVSFELRVVDTKQFMLMPRMAATLAQMPPLARLSMP